MAKIDKKVILGSNHNFKILEHPFANISKQDRKKVIDEIQKNAMKDYKNSLAKLQSLLKEYSPIAILSQISNYALFVGVGDSKLDASDRKISQAHIEICQALILQIKFEELNTKTPPPEIIQKIIDSLKILLDSTLLKTWDSKFSNLSEKDNNIRYFRDYVMAHTQNVRNWGDFTQVNNISSEIYSNFDDILLKNYGFNSAHVIQFFNYLIKEIEKKSTNMFQNFREIRKLSNVRDMVYYYHDFIDTDLYEAESLLQLLEKHNVTDKDDVFKGFIYPYHLDQYLPKTFMFNYKKIAKELNFDEEIIEGIVNKFSYLFGDLCEDNTEHLFLGNPIWTKPLIRIDKEYFFCPVPQLFFSFIMKSFDDLIENIDNNNLSDKKSRYLEDKIEKIVKTRFSEATVVSGFKWKEYENDLIIFIDTYIIIIEAKSGKITDSALRGSPDRLKKKVNELLIEPYTQSKRLKDKLIYLIDNPNVEDDIRCKLPISLTPTHKVLRVSVGLEYFASLQSNIASLKKTGWIPSDFSPCPTMSIGAFETLFDIFEHPVQIINYLEIREEIEGKIKYIGDELDLIAMYMDNHLNFGNIDLNMILMLAGMSKKIDDYYQLKDMGKNIDKPKPTMNNFFEKILKHLEYRKPNGWIFMSSVIYRLFPDDQQMIEDSICKLQKNVEENWYVAEHENMGIYCPPLLSHYAFCFVLFNNKNKEKRHDFFNEAIFKAFEPKHVQYCLAIGINIDMDNMPYSIIAVSSKADNEVEIEENLIMRRE